MPQPRTGGDGRTQARGSACLLSSPPAAVSRGLLFSPITQITAQLPLSPVVRWRDLRVAGEWGVNSQGCATRTRVAGGGATASKPARPQGLT